MSEPEKMVNEVKSPWPKRLAIGCVTLPVLLLVGVFAVNLLVKKMVSDRIEDELVKNGWKAELGGFDYSLWDKEVEIYDFSGVPMDRDRLEQFGEVQLKMARVKFDGNKEGYIGKLDISEAQAKFGKLDKLEIVPGKFIFAKGLTVNNPKDFGGGPLFEVQSVQIEFGGITKEGKQRYKRVELQIDRINIVKNMDGKWLTDGASQFQMELRKMESQKDGGAVPEVDSISVKIGEVAFLDLSQSGATQIIEVNQTIEENNNPKGYAVGVFLRIIGVIANAKNQPDF